MIYLAQMLRTYEGYSEPLFVTENMEEMDAFLKGCVASNNTSMIAWTIDAYSGEIKLYTDINIKPEDDNE